MDRQRNRQCHTHVELSVKGLSGLPTDVVLMTAVKRIQMSVGGGGLDCGAAAEHEQFSVRL